MDGLKNLLLRFKHLEPKEPKIASLVKRVIEDVLGVSIQEKQITIQQNTVFLLVSPVIKQAVQQKKEAILVKMRESEYGQGIVDVR